ncbi:uncharacterized protein LOC131878270 [Tigriopus californicus]|uniref:uncharacterized protein LOC131878270 n=1 Tax=Tigriopus californicus TaxID=6832 RepID=UPI0027DA8B42|nr:uncharacterized protein LOC131878270 [Tigriopus californicus]
MLLRRGCYNLKNTFGLWPDVGGSGLFVSLSTRNLHIRQTGKDCSPNSNTVVQYSFKVFASNSSKYPFLTLTSPMPSKQLKTDIKFKCKCDALQTLIELPFIDPDLLDKKELIEAWLAFIPEFSLSDLKLSVHSLFRAFNETDGNPNFQFLDQVVVTLDTACSEHLLGRSSISDIDVLHHFSLANAWLRIGMDDPLRVSHYLTCFVSHFSTSPLVERLESSQFVFLVFIMSTRRYCPNEVRTLSEPFGLKLAQVLPNLTFQEASLLAHGLHMMKIRISTPDSSIRTALLKRLYECDVSDLLKNNDELGISFVSRALLQRGKTETHAITKIQKHFLPYLDRLNSMLKVRLLALVAESPVKTGPRFIRVLSNSMTDQLSSLRIKDYLQLVQALHNSNCHNHQALCERIMTLITDEKRSHIKSGKIFVQLIGYLAKERVFNDAFLEEIFGTINRWGKELVDCKDPLTLAQVITEFTFELTRTMANDDVRQKIRDFESRQTQSVIVNILPHIATLDVNLRLDHPQYSGVRLAPHLRANFLARTVMESDASWAEKVRKDILKDLRSRLGGNLHYDYLLPHATSRDFAFVVHHAPQSKLLLESLVPFPYENYWNNLMLTNIPSVTKVLGRTDVQAVALIVPKRSEFDIKHGMVGKLLHKIRQLKQLGFHVGLISPVLYGRAKGNGDSDRFLQKCIRDAMRF